MGDNGLAVRFWGTRGSVPVSGPNHHRYGGNTSCVELRCGDKHLLIDAGSGLREAGDALLAEGVRDFDLIFTHCHYDHIIGLPFFTPLYLMETNVRLWSGHLAGKMSTATIVDQFLRPPWLPSETGYCKARLNYRDFKAGEVLEPGTGISLKSAKLRHNGGCVGYRVEWNGRRVAIIFDYEHQENDLDAEVLALMDQADLVIYDATFTEEEMPRFVGYGHSTAQHGIRMALEAKAKKLALFHHSPTRTDDQLDEMERRAHNEFPDVFAARDRQIIVV